MNTVVDCLAIPTNDGLHKKLNYYFMIFMLY